VEGFEIPQPWDKVFLMPDEVVTEYLKSVEGFSPQTVGALAKQADQTLALIEAHNVNTAEWTQRYVQWLRANRGPNGRTERPYRKEAWRRKGLRNHHNRLRAALEEAEQESAWTWVHGDCREEAGTMPGAARLLLTDPPYGMSYQSNHNADAHRQIQHDDGSALQLLGDALAVMKPHLEEDAHVLVFAHWSNEPDVRGVVAEHFEIKGSLIWAKKEHGLGDLSGTFSPSHERIIHAVHGTPPMVYRQKDVIEAAKFKSDHHPTVKPEPLLRALIKATTVEGELVADPFGGIGSTLQAALKEERRAWGCELSADWHVIGESKISAV